MSHTGTMPWDRESDEMDEEYRHIFKKPIRWGYRAIIAERTILFSDGSEETDIVEDVDDFFSMPQI